MYIIGKENLKISPSKIIVRKDKSLLTPRSPSIENQSCEKNQQSTENINLKVVQKELKRVREQYQIEFNEKWRILHEKNSLENAIKICDAQKMNAMTQNQKLREKIKEMIIKTDKLNQQKLETLNKIHEKQNAQRMLKSKIKNLQQSLQIQRNNKQSYLKGIKQNQDFDKKIKELTSELEALRFKNIQLQNLVNESRHANRLNIQQNSQLNSLKSLLEVAQKQNRQLSQRFLSKSKQFENLKQVFINEKNKLQNKAQELEIFLKSQKQEYQQRTEKLIEINHQTQNQNKRLMESISTDLSYSLSFGKNIQNDKETNQIRKQISQKDDKIRYLSQQVHNLRNIIHDMEAANNYNVQLSLSQEIYPNLRLRQCFKSATKVMTPKQFNLHNQMQAKRMRIQELEKYNKILQEKLQAQS